MFKIYGGATEFKQWNLDQLITNPCMNAGDEVVFRNASGETYVVKAFEQNGEVVADVPNYLLQKALNILVDLEQGADQHDDCRTIFTVTAQAKPKNYVCEYNIKDRTEKGVAGGSTGGDCDWNIMKNKPFYSEIGATILPETTVEFDPDAGEGMIADVIPVAVGNPYKVYWNGTEYFCVAGIVDMEGLPLVVLGDFSVMTGGESTGEPFVIAALPAEVAAEMGGAGATVLALDGSTSATVSIKETIVHTLNPVYLPKLDVKFTARYDYGGTFYGDADKSLDEIRSAIAHGVPVTGIVESTSEGLSFSYRLVVHQVSHMSVSFYYHNPVVDAYLVADYYADGTGDTFSGGFPVKFYRSKVVMDIVEAN